MLIKVKQTSDRHTCILFCGQRVVMMICGYFFFPFRKNQHYYYYSMKNYALINTHNYLPFTNYTAGMTQHFDEFCSIAK